MGSELADRIAATLGDRIRLGEIEAGARLRQEHIAQEFDASPGPVREAFRLMETSGLVVSRPRRGVVVASIDAASITEVSDMRAALEPLALHHAAVRLTADDLAAARTAIAAEARAGEDPIALEAANRDFHRALLRPCAMPMLMRAIDDLHIAASRILLAMWRDLPDWPRKSGDDHAQILDAVERGAIDEAAHLLETHITDGRDALSIWVSQRAD